MPTIKLTRLPVPDDMTPAWRQSWPLSVQAQGENMPSEIFVYQVGSANANLPGDMFSCIASINQLYEIPRLQGTSLTVSAGIPFYRRAQMDVICRSAAQAEYIWREVQLQVAQLVANFNSAQNLRGAEEVRIISEVESVAMTTNLPDYYQIAYAPAGTPVYASNVQDITSPDTTLPGWLPVSSAPTDWLKPAGAFLYYNIALDAGLQAIWPPASPFSSSELYRNGLLLPYGITHVFTKDTIWWLKFVPSTIAGYTRVGSVQDGNAVWPTDYVNRSSPGATPPIVAVKLFH